MQMVQRARTNVSFFFHVTKNGFYFLLFITHMQLTSTRYCYPPFEENSEKWGPSRIGKKKSFSIPPFAILQIVHLQAEIQQAKKQAFPLILKRNSPPAASSCIYVPLSASSGPAACPREEEEGTIRLRPPRAGPVPPPSGQGLESVTAPLAVPHHSRMCLSVSQNLRWNFSISQWARSL